MTFVEKTIDELISDGAIVEVQDGNHGEKHPKSSDYVESGIFFVMANDLGSGHIDFKNCTKIPENLALKLRKGFSKTGDVLLTHKGTVGNVAIVGLVEPYIMLTPQVTYYRVDSSKLSNKYLSYAFREPLFQKRIKSLAQQSTRPYIGITAQRNLTISWTERESQDSIVAILSSYDDLIENNRRRIALLEESARQLYKEWFVRFRFPGHEHVKIVDGVPERWDKGVVGNFAKVNSGFAFKSKDWVDEGNPVIKIKNISNSNTIDTESCQCVDDNVAAKAPKFELQAGDMLIAMTGATVGKVGILPPSSRRFFLNQRVGKFSSAIGRDVTPFLLSFFNSDGAQASISNLAGGAAQPNISAKQIESINCPSPPSSILNSFLDQTEYLFSLRLNLIDQNNKLTRARALLLPKLMSGELTV
jgi:type I restriction enzyme S subunit